MIRERSQWVGARPAGHPKAEAGRWRPVLRPALTSVTRRTLNNAFPRSGASVSADCGPFSGPLPCSP